LDKAEVETVWVQWGQLMNDSLSMQGLLTALIELDYAIADFAHRKASTKDHTEFVQLETALSQLVRGRAAISSGLRTLELKERDSSSGRAA
jgi:hypothetical protein